jgi:nucleotide-binding universal stress UspA family protein
MTHACPPKRVVVGYDAGPSSRNLALAALDLRRRFGTLVHFMHVVDIPPPEDVAGRPDVVVLAEAEIQARAYDHVHEQLQELDPENELGLNDHLVVHVGRPAQRLVQFAREVDADTLMLGPHQRSGLFDFGSTTRGIIGSARCDLWVQTGPPRQIQRILAPIDLSEESLRALACARDLAQEYGASVTALHCFQPPEVAYAASPGYPIAGPVYVVEDVRRLAQEEFQRTLEDFDWGSVEHSPLFIEGHPAEVTLEQQEGHDLIAIGTHGRTGLTAAVLGNVAHSVLRGATIPVLALRHPSRTWLLE